MFANYSDNRFLRKAMNENRHSTHIELDGYSTGSSSLADFGDTGSVDEDEAKNVDLINIQEVTMSDTDSFKDEDDGSNDPFPATSFVLRLNRRIHQEAIPWFVQKITGKKQHGGAELLVKCEPYSGHAGECIVLHVTASIIRFLEVAEFLELKKEDDTGLKREFQVRDLDSFIHGDITLDSFITPAEKQVIVLHELENIRALPGEPHIPGYPGFVLHSRQSIWQVFFTERLIYTFYPLHDEKQLAKLKQTNWFWAFWNPEPFEELRRYFGEAITLYFTFSAYYTSALVIPAIISIFLLFIPDTVLSKETSIACLCCFNVIFVSYILKVWKRKCSELAYIWGTLRMSRWEEPRIEYRGKMSIDPVTGKYVPKYPWWKTGVKAYLVSMPLVCVCMVSAFMVMIYYFKAEDLLAPAKASLKGTWKIHLIEFIPSITYATLVALMTHYYRKFAYKLTEWENHRTQAQFDKHHVGKLVPFEFVNNFMSFIYIAFYLHDDDKLKHQLKVMLITLHIIVVLQEAILPLFIRETSAKMANFLNRDHTSVIRIRLLSAREKKAVVPRASSVARSHWNPANFGLESLDKNDARIEMSKMEGKMEPYKGSFDDYLQLFIQFGYVFLFSPVLPVSVAIAAFSNFFLIWASVFKLCLVFQRPIPRRIKDIGTWQLAFEFLGFLSVITNCGLIAIFTAKKMSWLEGKSPIEVFFIIVVIEHVLIGIKLAFSRIIPNVPYWVKIAVARIEYKSRMAFKKEQQVKSRRRLTLQFQAINLRLRGMDEPSNTTVMDTAPGVTPVSRNSVTNRNPSRSTAGNQSRSRNPN